RVYGAANPAFSGTVIGFVNGEDLASATTGTPTFSSAATASSPVGDYAIDGSGLTTANYTFAQAAANATAVTITASVLTITADDQSKTYGSGNPALTYTPSGFVNGDTATVLSGSPSVSTTATAGSGVGGYPITISAGTLAAANYSFAFVDG